MEPFPSNSFNTTTHFNHRTIYWTVGLWLLKVILPIHGQTAIPVLTFGQIPLTIIKYYLIKTVLGNGGCHRAYWLQQDYDLCIVKISVIINYVTPTH